MLKVFILPVECPDARAVIMLESTPPLKKMPRGTSLIRRILTESESILFISHAASFSPVINLFFLFFARSFALQYFSIVTLPFLKESAEPGSSFLTDLNIVLGALT